MDARDTIYQELTSSRVPGEKKVTGDAFMICCPFHSDTNPSLGVNLTTDTNIPLGFFHCFGCSVKGNWNSLAKKLGLREMKDWELGIIGQSSTRKRVEVLYTDEDKKLKDSIYTNEAITWPVSVPWRGYKGDLLHKLGALYYNDRLTMELMAFFPIYTGKRYRGGVRAYLEKQVNGNSYITTKGKWVKDYGILGYQYVKTIIRKYQYNAIILVEGPRDMLRLLSNRIPAVAVLGIEAMSRKKIIHIMALSSRIRRIYVMPDNDKAGRKMIQNVRAAAEGLVEVKSIGLPREYDKNKNLIKMDPDDCPQELIDEVRIMFRSHRLLKTGELIDICD